MKLRLIPIILILSTNLYAESYQHNELSVSTGMYSVTVAETEVTSSSSSDSSSSTAISTAAENGVVSQIALDISYTFYSSDRISIYANSILPLMTSNGTGGFMGGVGINYYIMSRGSRHTVIHSEVKIEITPKLRYYVGGMLSGGYIVYLTDTAEKSDSLIEISFHGGIKYNFDKEWGLISEIQMGKGTGVVSSTISMKATAGVNYTF